MGTRAVVAALGAFACLGLLSVGPSAPAALPLISEVVYDAVGSDDGLGFVEPSGTPGMDLTGLMIEGINGSNGSVTHSIPLSGLIPANGIFVLADTFSGGGTVVPDVDPLASFDFQLQAMTAGEDAIRATFDYQAAAAPVGPVFAFDDVSPGNRLSVDVTAAAKADAAGAGNYSGYRLQVVDPNLVGDVDSDIEYLELDGSSGTADPKLRIVDELSSAVPGLGALAGALLAGALATIGVRSHARRGRSR